MSRIGKLPITLPAGVTVTFEDSIVTVKGAKGTLTQQVVGEIDVKIEGNVVHVVKKVDTKEWEAKHGLYRALIHNMVVGVSQGFSKTLKIAGIGWKAQKQGNKLVLNVGYSHPVEMVEPSDVKFEVPAPNQIIVSGISKERVGQVSAEIRSVRKPEPYKGFGIAYSDEVIERKEGKTGGKGKK